MHWPWRSWNLIKQTKIRQIKYLGKVAVRDVSLTLQWMVHPLLSEIFYFYFIFLHSSVCHTGHVTQIYSHLWQGMESRLRKAVLSFCAEEGQGRKAWGQRGLAAPQHITGLFQGQTTPALHSEEWLCFMWNQNLSLPYVRGDLSGRCSEGGMARRSERSWLGLHSSHCLPWEPWTSCLVLWARVHLTERWGY